MSALMDLVQTKRVGCFRFRPITNFSKSEDYRIPLFCLYFQFRNRLWIFPIDLAFYISPKKIVQLCRIT